MDPPGRPAERRAVVEQHARRREARVATAGPRVRRPVHLVVGGRLERLRTKVGGEVVDYRRAPLSRALLRVDARRRPLDEAEQHARLPVRRRVVERDAHGRRVAHCLAGQTRVAPERLVVHGLALDHGAVGEALRQLVAQRRQRRVEVDPAG